MSTETTEASTESVRLTDNQIQIIEDLKSLQLELGKNDQDFARDHLAKSGTVWYRVKNGDYFKLIKDADSLLFQFGRDLFNLQRERALQLRQTSGKIFSLNDTDAVIKGMEECWIKNLADPDRCVVYLAPTGGGKTTLGLVVRKKFGARVVIVEARRAWQTSPISAARDVAKGLGLNVSSLYTLCDIEDEIIKELNRKKRYLIIDEGEFFGPDAINMIKLFLNQTQTVVLITAIGSAYDKWNKMAPHESRQLQRRTHLIIRHNAISPEVAMKFIAECELSKKDLADAAVLLAKGANQFGTYDLCNRVAKALRTEGKIDIDEVNKAILHAHKQMGFAPEA